MTQKLPEDFLKRLAAVKNKRARAVIDRILEKDYVTTEELKNLGYNHPPRAARDVREEGIPLETFYDKRALDGTRMASYRFGDLSKVRHDRIGGRAIFKKGFKKELIGIYGRRCNICSGEFEDRYLQIDHRVPYEVGGDTDRDPTHHQLLDGSCNRAKAWSCEHCENGIDIKDPEICKTCYWAFPESYEHVAMRKIRRLDILWDEEEIETYDELKIQSNKDHTSMPDFVKTLLRKLIRN